MSTGQPDTPESVEDPDTPESVEDPDTRESVEDPGTRESVEDEVLRFLEAKTKVRWEVDRDLFDSGVVSSMFAMELVVYLEKTFGIAVLGADLQMANFRSVRAMANLVARLGPRGDGAGGGGGAEAVLAG